MQQSWERTWVWRHGNGVNAIYKMGISCILQREWQAKMRAQTWMRGGKMSYCYTKYGALCVGIGGYRGCPPDIPTWGPHCINFCMSFKFSIQPLRVGGMRTIQRPIFRHIYFTISFYISFQPRGKPVLRAQHTHQPDLSCPMRIISRPVVWAKANLKSA